MKTCTCRNETCTQNGVNEYMMGSPETVMCGVCRTPVELSDEYEDPEQPIMGQP